MILIYIKLTIQILATEWVLKKNGKTFYTEHNVNTVQNMFEDPEILDVHAIGTCF